jgi:hypothetical protein
VGKTGLACGILLKAPQNGLRCQFIRAQDRFGEMYAWLAGRSTRKLVNHLARLGVPLIGLCEVVSNVELSAGSPASWHSGGAQLHICTGYSDSSQSRMVLSLLHGERERRGTGLTRAMAFRFISRPALA